MKKTVSMLLVLLLLLGCTACGRAKQLASKAGELAGQLEEVQQALASQEVQIAQPSPESSKPEQPTPAQTAEAEPIENRVALALDKLNYEPEERIEVTLDSAMIGDGSAAVIAVVDSQAEHGSESVIHDAYSEYRYLADFSEQPFYLWAPESAGQFDVRVYADDVGGEELACISIGVGGVEPLPSPKAA